MRFVVLWCFMLAASGHEILPDNLAGVNAGIGLACDQHGRPSYIGDLHGYYFLFNGSVEYSKPLKAQSDEVITGFRAYGGLGIANIVEVQGGGGKNGASIRFRTDLPIDKLYEAINRPGSADPLVTPTGSPMVTAEAEICKRGARYSVLLGIGF